jgi:F0F1-type ATP synthase membrane subunit c/vacuolar-type H+-ATPase subunit K
VAVFASIAAGYPNGIAVSVAVKALARYPELKATTSAAAERFIIGTFVSVLWACGWAGMARWVLTLY